MKYSVLLAALLVSAPAFGQVEYELEEDFTAEELSALLERDELGIAADAATTHAVARGDTLSGLAGRLYGDQGLWPAIWAANADLIGDDPANLRVGMVLDIPGFDEAIEYGGGAPVAESRAAALDVPLGDEGPDIDPVAESQVMPDWMYTEGIARAIRREYLTFEQAGRIAYVDPALKEGDRVEAGHVIAYQDQRRPGAQVENANAQIVNARTQLAVQEATLMEVRANLRLAERTFERFRVLLEQNSASQQEYDQAEAQLESARAAALRAERQIEAARAQVTVGEAGLATAQVAQDESYLVAPIAGLIASHNIEQGDYYAPQMIQTQSEQALFSTVPVIIIDPSRFEISINIPSDRFDDIAVGARALMEIVDQDATLEERLPDEAAGPPKAPGDYVIEGMIYSISPVMDPDLRNFSVKVHTIRGHELLRDGETVSLWIRRAG